MKSLQDQLSQIKNSLKPSERRIKVSSTKNSEAPSKEITLGENKYKHCPECGCKLRISRYRKHMALQHGIQAISSKEDTEIRISKLEQDEIVKCPTCSASVKNKNLQKHISRVHQSPKPKKKKKKKKGIRLISKRGMKVSGRHSCTNCNKIIDNPTRYAESNIGPVILCAPCKSKIRLRSFPSEKRDALDFATTGGGFEGNRRKH